MAQRLVYYGVPDFADHRKIYMELKAKFSEIGICHLEVRSDRHGAAKDGTGQQLLYLGELADILTGDRHTRTGHETVS
jgi:hypothetical protein